MHAFPRSNQPFLSVERTPVEGSCPACGASELAAYPVLSDGGWWDVVKCQACLESIRREPGPMFGPFVPLSHQVGR
jgi:hypothetical protein